MIVKFFERFDFGLNMLSPILCTILFFMSLFWAMQLAGPTKQLVVNFVTTQKMRDINKESQQLAEFIKFVETKLDRAKNMGAGYNSTNYFSDILEIKKRQVVFKQANPALYITQLNELRLKNDSFDEAYHIARKKFEKEWGSFRKEYHEDLGTDLFSFFNWRELVQSQWVKVFYFRSMLLVFFLYLIRMADRKGILETILADKKKFTLAIIGWPMFLFKYPNNVIREIKVEVVLRSWGKIFRHLSSQELRLVKDVANSESYSLWIKNRNNRNGRALILALLVTIFFRLLPIFHSAWIIKSSTMVLNKSSPIVMAMLVSAVSNDSSESSTTINQFDLEIITPIVSISVLLVVMEKLGVLLEILQSLFIFEIFHVPIRRLFGLNVLFLNNY